jgi:anti-sigma factor RsiW
MEKKCDVYTSEDISRFVDIELSSDQCRAFEHHLSLCSECSRLVSQYKNLSLAFSRHTHKRAMGIAALNLEHKLEQKIQCSEQKPYQNISGLFGKNLYLKLAGIAAVVMIGFFSFDPTLFGPPSGPSAIVNSVDTEYTSVMIIETKEEKHTIIWFSEET